MNKRTIVVLCVLALAVLLFVFLGQEKTVDTPTEMVEVVEPNESSPVIGNAEAVAPVESVQGDEKSMDVLTRKYLEKSMTVPKYDWKQPIKFYGKVVTLDGQPLEGVTVEYGWTSLTGYDRRTVQSDVNGLFDLTDVRGKSMTLKLEKEGYDWFSTRTQSSFEFAEPYDPDFHEANPDEPLIYYMQERPEAEPLYVWKTRRGVILAHKGPVYYDYTTGRFSKSSGENSIQMDLQIDPADEENTEPYNWTITLSGPSYQFYQTEDYVRSIAPDVNYSKQAQFGKSVTDEDWFNRRTYRVFFKDESGNYGYLYLSPRVKKESQKVNITLDSYFNPSGSPVLVFNSRKRIR